MYSRKIVLPKDKSFFLFGPRATGKTTLIKKRYKKALYINLLDSKTLLKLAARPDRLNELVPQGFREFVIIDEIQKVPELLNEVHRLIEEKKIKFILTGSSARKLRRGGHNLLAGRALRYDLHPLSAVELGNDFTLEFALKYGSLPAIFSESNPEKYLYTYVKTYLQEEIIQEGLTRNLSAFTRFLETASFSVGSQINFSAIAQETWIERKVVENYFSILEDLMLGIRLYPFTRRAKRKLIVRPKFYFFDTGIFQTVRPSGPVDTPSEIGGLALENLVFQNLIAINDSFDLGYRFYYYQTVAGTEVDFIVYGPRGFHAIEVKHSENFSNKHLRGLKAFAKIYSEAKLHFFYTGKQTMYIDDITIHPIEETLKNLNKVL